MFKKLLAGFTVATIVASLTFTPAVTAYANGDGTDTTITDDANKTKDGADTGTDKSADDAQDTKDQTKDADQDVKADPPAKDTVTANSSNPEVIVESITVTDGKTAINASGPDTQVTVVGDVTSSGTSGKTYKDSLGKEYYESDDAVIADSGATVIIGGDLKATGDEQDGIDADGGAVVIVNGDVKANGYGIDANNSKITVEGGVNSANDAIFAYDGGRIIVNGDVSSSGMHTVYSSDYDKETKTYKTKKEAYDGDGIHTDGTTDIFVDGDVHGTTTAIAVMRGADTISKNAKIIITGTISSASDSSDRILIGNAVKYDLEGNEVRAKYESLDDLKATIPDITVYAFDKPYVYVSRKVEDEKVTYSEIQSALTDSIKFIIKQDENSVKNYGLKLADDNENIKAVQAPTNATFDTVNVGKAFKVAASIPEGYMLTGGDNVKVTDNNDGTYTLLLYNPKGGIYIQAIVRPVPESKKEDDDGGQQYEVVVQEVTPAYADPNQAPAGAIVVADTATAAAAPELAAISGTKPARTVSYSIANITPLQYKNSIIENVAKAPAGGAFNIETDRVACFDAKMIQAFAANPTIDINVVFTYGGRRLRVRIPAGYNVVSLLDSNGYCGFLRLLDILGGEEI